MFLTESAEKERLPNLDMATPQLRHHSTSLNLKQEACSSRRKRIKARRKSGLNTLHRSTQSKGNCWRISSSARNSIRPLRARPLVGGVVPRPCFLSDSVFCLSPRAWKGSLAVTLAFTLLCPNGVALCAVPLRARPLCLCPV